MFPRNMEIVLRSIVDYCDITLSYVPLYNTNQHIKHTTEMATAPDSVPAYTHQRHPATEIVLVNYW